MAPVALSLPHWTGPVTSAPSPPLESCKSAQGRVQKYRPGGCFLRKSSDPFFFFSGCVLGDHGKTSSLHFTRAQKLWGFTRRQKAIKDSLLPLFSPLQKQVVPHLRPKLLPALFGRFLPLREHWKVWPWACRTQMRCSEMHIGGAQVAQ